MMYQKGTRAVKPIVFHSGIMQMYLVGDSFRVSFKWVVIISTKQETAHTQSAKVSTSPITHSSHMNMHMRDNNMQKIVEKNSFLSALVEAYISFCNG